MSKPLAERYVHYNAKDASPWQVLAASSIGEQVIGLQKLESYLKDGYSVAPGEVVEASFEEEQLAADVAAFIEKETGLKVTCSLGKYTQLHDQKNGAYNTILHHTAVHKHIVGSDYGDTIAFGSLLAHEFAHSTLINTAKILDLQDEENHLIRTLHAHHITDITPSFTNENFFEEGFAEEIASRWRQQFDPALLERNRELLSYEGSQAIPVRMYSPAAPINETTTDMERGYTYPAFCSFGIQLLSEYTGVDLIDLLIQARKPKTQLEASRRLKEVVDWVEPDLYELLTIAQYSQDDFEDCLRIIKDAIANHAHSQIK